MVVRSLAMPIEIDWDQATLPITQVLGAIRWARPSTPPDQIKPIACLVTGYGGTQINASVLKKNGQPHVFLSTNAKMDAHASKFTTMFGRQRTFGSMASTYLKNDFANLKTMPIGTMNCFNLLDQDAGLSYLYSINPQGEIFFQYRQQEILEPLARQSLCTMWDGVKWECQQHHWPAFESGEMDRNLGKILEDGTHTNSVLLLLTVDGSCRPTVDNTLCVRLIGPNYRSVQRAINNTPDTIKRLFILAMFWHGGVASINHFEETHADHRGIERADNGITPERAMYYIGVLAWHNPRQYHIFVYFVECLLEKRANLRKRTDLHKRNKQAGEDGIVMRDEIFDELFRHDPSGDIRARANEMMREAHEYAPMPPHSGMMSRALCDLFSETTEELRDEWCPYAYPAPDLKGETADETAEATMARYVRQNTLLKND